MPTTAQMTCPKCNEANDYVKFGVIPLQEGALMVCPVCNAEFSIQATLERTPGQEGEEMDFQPQSDEPEPEPAAAAEPPAEEPSPDELAGGGGDEDFGFESAQGKKFTPRVLECTSCGADWIGTHAKLCPRCGEATVLLSAKTTRERVKEAFEEVERGVPNDRAIAKMLGRYSLLRS